jgi:hypothetical protein
MEKCGTKFLRGFIPVSFTKRSDGKIIVKYSSIADNS